MDYRRHFQKLDLHGRLDISKSALWKITQVFLRSIDYKEIRLSIESWEHLMHVKHKMKNILSCNDMKKMIQYSSDQNDKKISKGLNDFNDSQRNRFTLEF